MGKIEVSPKGQCTHAIRKCVTTIDLNIEIIGIIKLNDENDGLNEDSLRSLIACNCIILALSQGKMCRIQFIAKSNTKYCLANRIRRAFACLKSIKYAHRHRYPNNVNNTIQYDAFNITQWLLTSEEYR